MVLSPVVHVCSSSAGAAARAAPCAPWASLPPRHLRCFCWKSCCFPYLVKEYTRRASLSCRDPVCTLSSVTLLSFGCRFHSLLLGLFVSVLFWAFEWLPSFFCFFCYISLFMHYQVFFFCVCAPSLLHRWLLFDILFSNENQTTVEWRPHYFCFFCLFCYFCFRTLLMRSIWSLRVSCFMSTGRISFI